MVLLLRFMCINDIGNYNHPSKQLIVVSHKSSGTDPSILQQIKRVCV